MRQLQRSERHQGTGCLASTPVVLHIYDLAKSETVQGVNSVLRAMGAGAFHAGVEVYGIEWSYGCMDQPDGSGVFQCTPKGCTDHFYRESLPMGMTTKSPDDVAKLLATMRAFWAAGKYDVLHHNCCHFCDDFCKELGVDGLPFWVSLNISGVGASLRRLMKSSLSTSWANSIGKSVGASIGVDPGFMHGGPEQYDQSSWQASRKPRALLNPRIGPHVVARGADDGTGGWCHLGDEVEVFSNSTQAWCRARIEGVQVGIALLGYQPPGVGQDTMVWKEVAVDDPSIRPAPAEDFVDRRPSWPSQLPQEFMDKRPSWPSPPVGGGHLGESVIMQDFMAPPPAPAPGMTTSTFADGEAVEVFSNSLQMWCPGYVEHAFGDMVAVAFFWPGAEEPAHKELHKDHGDLRRATPANVNARRQPSRRVLA